jgi:hypothetical protein
LEWPLQKAFKEQRIHWSTNSSPPPSACPVASTLKIRPNGPLWPSFYRYKGSKRTLAAQEN